MKKSIKIIKNGFENSSLLTSEFAKFFRTFKSEFTKELKSINATNIVFSRGHFSLSGFFTIGSQAWYFSLSDVRGIDISSDSCLNKLLYRKANNYNDFRGGTNNYVRINDGMANEMILL